MTGSSAINCAQFVSIVGQMRYKETKLDKRAFSNDGLQSINSGAGTRIHAAPSSWQLVFAISLNHAIYML